MDEQFNLNKVNVDYINGMEFEYDENGNKIYRKRGQGDGLNQSGAGSSYGNNNS